MTARAVMVRGMEPTDYDAWLPLWQGYQQFYRVNIPAATSAITWTRILDPGEPIHGGLAVCEGRPVGIVHYIMHRSCWTIGDYCYLQDLFVVDGQRGLGAGRKLIEHVYAVAHAGKCSRVYWLTHETNNNAMLLYDRIAERSGFVQYRKIFT
jgi:GNAT superfamily N-acetyltransferase